MSGATKSAINKFRIDIPQQSLDDLHDRLTRARWASEVPAPNPEAYGVSLAWVRELTEYWRGSYNWRAAEARLNTYPQFVTEVDGQDIHFLHVESPEPDPIPLILTHGWPGSVVEFLNIIGPLTDPRAHGKDPPVAFDLVIPSLPGFAFSAPLHDQGWSTQRTAATWAKLMPRIGYERYGAVGNDAGSMISPEIGRLDPEHVIAHVALYWLTDTAGSSIRFYYEGAHGAQHPEPTTVPLGVAGFAGDFSGVRRFAERDHKNLVQWNTHPEPGGHYAAHLEPDVLADDIRDFYRRPPRLARRRTRWPPALRSARPRMSLASS